ncbi:hypothetical protein I546_4855 [Mycobacterium kansasii 732]|nr:hypothetical protein I546_4855 [Mycobacterium kansasii 732]
MCAARRLSAKTATLSAIRRPAVPGYPEPNRPVGAMMPVEMEVADAVHA